MKTFDELVLEFEQRGADRFRAEHKHPFLVYVPPDVQAATGSTRKLLASLGVQRGAQDGERGTSPVAFELIARDPRKAEVSIGRSRDADVTIPLPRISKTQAAIRLEGRGEGFVLVDGGSKNGTAVAGALVKAGAAARIKNADPVDMGPYQFRFYTADGFQALVVQCSGTGSVDIGDLTARRGDASQDTVIVERRSAELEDEISKQSTGSAALPVVPQVSAGQYEIVRRLGVGGMADVVLAKRLGPSGFSKMVALKRILPQFASSESFVSMFVQEARIAARVNHPNVVQIFELGQTDGQYFIAMEYVDGWDLATIIKSAARLDRELPLGVVCRIAADICAGLHAAHSCVDEDGHPLNIVHRDISPHNVLVTHSCISKIADFGVSRAADSLRQTKTGELKGKIIYMAPEQVDPAIGEIDARTDVYAIGLTIYEMLTGTAPLRRMNEVMALQAALEAQVPDVRERRPDTPPRLAKAVMGALARLPQDRFQSAQELQYEIERAIIEENLTSTAMSAAQYLRELREAVVALGPAKVPVRPAEPVQSAVTARVIVDAKSASGRPPSRGGKDGDT